MTGRRTVRRAVFPWPVLWLALLVLAAGCHPTPRHAHAWGDAIAAGGCSHRRRGVSVRQDRSGADG